MAHPSLWAGENWSRVAGAGRFHRIDTEHNNFCILYCENGQSWQQILFYAAKNYFIHNAEKYGVFCSIFSMSGIDQYGRRLLL